MRIHSPLGLDWVLPGLRSRGMYCVFRFGMDEKEVRQEGGRPIPVVRILDNRPLKSRSVVKSHGRAKVLRWVGLALLGFWGLIIVLVRRVL